MAAKRKGLLKYDGDDDEYLRYVARETTISDQLVAIDQVRQSHELPDRLDELGMLRLCHSVAAADRLRLDNSAPISVGSEPIESVRRLEEAVQDVNALEAATAIASGARVESSHIRRIMTRITADHAPFFSLLLSHCPAYSAKVVCSQSVDEELNRCVSPLIVIILKTHIDRWRRVEVTARELKTLMLEAAPVISSRTLSVSMWRTLVRLSVEKMREKCEAAASSPQGKHVNRVYRETLESFLHPTLLRPYADAPIADIQGQLNALEALTETMRSMSLTSRAAMRERDVALLKRGIERTCRLNYIDLKEILAAQRGELDELTKRSFNAERADVHNVHRSIEERLVISNEDFETRILSNFSNMFVETCNLVPPNTQISPESVDYKARLWTIFAHQTFVRVLKFILRNFNVRNMVIPDDIFSLGSGVIANWLIHSFLQNQSEIKSPSQVQSSAYVLWSCFPPGWWSPARINASMLEELSWIDASKHTQKIAIDAKTEAISNLSNQIEAMKVFMKKAQKELGAIGKKAHSKIRKDSKVLDGLAAAIAAIQRRQLSLSKSRDKLESQIKECEVLYRDGKLEETVEASGIQADASKKDSLRANDYQNYLKAFAFDCLEILRKRQSDMLEQIESLKVKMEHAEREFQLATEKTSRTTFLIRNLTRDKFNMLVDTREMVVKKQKEIEELSEQIQSIKLKDSLVSSYDQSVRNTAAFLSSQPEDRFAMPTLGRAMAQRPRNAMRHNILLENDVDSPALILASSLNLDHPVIDEAVLLDEKAIEAENLSSNVLSMTSDDVIADDTAKDDESSQAASSTDAIDEQSDDSLVFGVASKSSIAATAREEDISEEIVREMVFNEYWSLVGGRYVPEIKEREPDVATLLKSRSELDLTLVDRVKPTRKKLAFDKNKLAAYRNVIDEESESEEELEQRPLAIEQAKATEALPPSWLSDAIDVRLMSVSMSQDAELELLDARLAPQRNVQHDKRSATRMSFSGSGLNFKNGDPFVLAGLARLTRISDGGTALIELEVIQGLEELAAESDGPLKEGESTAGILEEQIDQPMEHTLGLHSLEFSTSPVRSRRSIASSHAESELTSKSSGRTRASAPAILPVSQSSDEGLSESQVPLIGKSESTESDLEMIRAQLDEDAKVVDVERHQEIKQDLMQPPTEIERQVFRTRKKKTETLRHGPETSRPYAQRLIRRTNPLRRSQSNTLQLAVLKFQEETELKSFLKVESVRTSRQSSSRGQGLSITVEDEAMNYANYDNAQESPKDWTAISRAVTAEVQPLQRKIGAVISTDSIESSVSAEFPTIRVREAEDYRPRYPNLSILVRAEALKMRKAASEGLDDVSAVDHGAGEFMLTEDVLERCINNVKIRLEMNANSAPRPRHVQSRRETNLTLLSTFAHGRLAAGASPSSSSLELTRTVIATGQRRPEPKETDSKPQNSSAFMPSVMSSRRSVKPLPGLLPTSSVDAAAFSDLRLTSSSLKLPATTETCRPTDYLTEISPSELLEHDQDIGELSSLGLAYAAILGLNPIQRAGDDTPLGPTSDQGFEQSLNFNVNERSLPTSQAPIEEQPLQTLSMAETQTDTESVATSLLRGEGAPINDLAREPKLDEMSSALVSSKETSISTAPDFELEMDLELRKLFREAQMPKAKVKQPKAPTKQKASIGMLSVSGMRMKK